MLCLAPAIAAGMLLGLPRQAAAHAHLRWSSPAAGSTVGAGVREVRLRFSEAVEPSFTSVTLTGPDGKPLPSGGITFPSDGGGRMAVIALSTPMGAGSWTVAWKTAAADGHASRGTFRFTVRAPSPPIVASATPPATNVAAPAATAPDRTATVTGAHEQHRSDADATETMHRDSPIEVAVRWIGFITLLLMVGGVAFHFGVTARVAGDFPAAAADADRRAAWIALVAALVSAVPLVLRLGIESSAVGTADDAWSWDGLHAMMLHSAWGHAWVLQAEATAVFVIAVALATRGWRVGWFVAAITGAAIALVPALSGHAAASTPRTLAIGLDWAHVLGACMWLGSLACLLAAGIPAALRAAEGKEGAIAVFVNRFSPVALAGALVAVASGVGSAALRLESVSQLWTTGYGLTLLAKLALLVPTAALGMYNWRVVRPGLASGATTVRLRSTARAEIAIAVLVLLATAILVGTPSP
ncbi:MAG TPA: copper resistance protein CopC [Longimicrobiaceae bacterium]|nr:copper resistance protein CopC [Longimicrobiaceae bacterium]